MVGLSKHESCDILDLPLMPRDPRHGARRSAPTNPAGRVGGRVRDRPSALSDAREGTVASASGTIEAYWSSSPTAPIILSVCHSDARSNQRLNGYTVL